MDDKKTNINMVSEVVKLPLSGIGEVLTDSAVAKLTCSPEVMLTASSIAQLSPSKLAEIDASSLAEVLQSVASQMPSSQVAEMLRSAVANLSESQLLSISRSAVADISEVLKAQPLASSAEIRLSGDKSSIDSIVSAAKTWNEKNDISITGDTPVK